MIGDFPLLESIRCEDGRFPLLNAHQERIARSVERLWPGEPIPSLAAHLKAHPAPGSGLFKCRILYGKTLSAPDYQPYVLKPPKQLKLIEDNTIDYALKWADRNHLNHLFGLRGACDDVLIVRDGLITDTTYCNIAFLSDGSWFTPALPLLAGVRRNDLLDKGIIRLMEIPVAGLPAFSHFKVFNAMIGWEDSEPQPIGMVFA
ncbi:MAG: aminotransferase class IV [Bacteroidetes bacterium]|nr:aminotransferase class IV [Bacteroidota bacterium]